MSPNDATINLAGNGASDGGFSGGLFKNETSGIAGMLATLRVDNVSGNCEIGIKATIGQIGNKQIRIFMFLSEYNGSEGIGFRIYTYDIFYATSALLATGTFGPWDGAWVLGQPQKVAFAIFGYELWFYADGYKQLHKIQLLDGMKPLAGPLGGYVDTSKGTDVSIMGSVSDIYFYYP